MGEFADMALENADWMEPWDWGGYEGLSASRDDLLNQAVEGGLWLDRKGNLYEMSELSDNHIANIIRFDEKFPAEYEPLIGLVKKEKKRRDSLRRNKFFREEQVI